MPYQKHLGLILDQKLNFKQHIDCAISKINKSIAVIKKRRYSLPRKSLVTIYKAFLRPLIDYGDIIYDKRQNESFSEKLEGVQYKAALAITGMIQGTSRDRIYQELGLESLKSRRWYKRLGCMFKIMNEHAPNYLINLIPKCEKTIRTRNSHIPTYHCRTDCFKFSFLPATLSDWFNLDPSINWFNLDPSIQSISSFKSKLLSFIRPVQSNVYNIFDPQGLKLLTRLHLGISHLNEHRFRHNFQDCISSLCSCSLEIEDTSHYLLHCHNFSRYRIDLTNSVNFVRDHFESLFDSSKRDILLYGNSRLDTNKNKFILVATINYIKHSERFV